MITAVRGNGGGGGGGGVEALLEGYTGIICNIIMYFEQGWPDL